MKGVEVSEVLGMGIFSHHTVIPVV
jgi:hypothetical protein